MSEARQITGSMLHDLVACERRVHHDLHTDASLRDPVSEFVKMLWEGGRNHETAVLARLEGRIEDLRGLPPREAERATLAALDGQGDIILGARLVSGDLLGMPDMVVRSAQGWEACDVKSGSALEADGRRPRREYGVQVALYARLLREAGAGSGTTARIIGSDGEVVRYDLQAPLGRAGTQGLSELTADLVETARLIAVGAATTRGALSAKCKLCHWHMLCEAELVQAEDATLVAGIGRGVRDALLPVAPSVSALASLDVDALSLPGGRTGVPGLGSSRLRRFRARARLLLTPGARPYAFRALDLPVTPREFHLDIEADPARDGLVYLHGILIREADAAGCRSHYVHFFADGPDGERDAFAAAMELLASNPEAPIYYYSRYERTSYRALQARHPGVCSPEDVEALFDPARAIDLLSDVIMPHTEWPTRSLGIKTLARFLGFSWRDLDPSGANSIAWFDEYVRSGDPLVRQRIIDYNEDDVLASAAVLDGLRVLPLGSEPPWPPA